MILCSKLNVYGFSTNASNLMHRKNRKQKVQINNKFSLERSVIAGVPQGSIDGRYSLICLLMILYFLFNIVY